MLKKFKEDTKQYKLFKALVLDGETLTEAAISKRFGIANVHAQANEKLQPLLVC
jgi:hypothetical protein